MMMRRTSSSSQRGFSLVELMIALTLSIILLAGVIEIFLSNKKAFEITTDLGVLQESGRIGSAVMSESIRMAGHWGGVEPSAVKIGTTTLTAAPGNCNAAWVFAPGNPIEGFDGKSVVTSVDDDLPSGCIAEGDYVPDSDLLVVRYADSSELFSDDQIENDGNASKYFSRIAIGQQAQLFQGASEDAADAVSTIASDDGVYNFGYRTELYFLRPCSIKDGSACNDGIPTLTRLTLSGSSFTQQALVEGIEQMQFDYGVDQDGDQRVDTYETADDIDDWMQVMSVRMSLVARASTKDVTVDEEDKEYLLVGDMATEGEGYTVAAADKHYRRKQYTREIHLRNRSRI